MRAAPGRSWGAPRFGGVKDSPPTHSPVSPHGLGMNTYRRQTDVTPKPQDLPSNEHCMNFTLSS